MTLIWLSLVCMSISVGRNDASDITIENSLNTTIHSSIANGKLVKKWEIDETLLDREWQRYLNKLRRLKINEMKKAIRTRVLNENIHPYFSLKQIRRRLDLLKMFDPRNVEVSYVKNLMQEHSIYRTSSGQGILYVKISENDDDGDPEMKIKLARPIVVIVAGIGGNDWTAVQTIMHAITYLVTSYEGDKLSGFDWWIIPLLNPDGYITSMSNKMSRNYQSNIDPTNGCWGVNLDRNFLLQRATCRCGKVTDNCQEHPGEYPFSEIESCALRDFIFSRADDCQVFMALKEGAKALVYPFASTPSSPSGPNKVLQDLLCAEALEVFDEFHTGTKQLFTFGNSGSIFGTSSGYVEDWAKRHMGIPRSFAFYITKRGDHENEPLKRLEEYGKGTLKVIEILATSRRIDPYIESFEEMTRNETRNDFSKFETRPIPWGRELINKNLLNKIKRGANLEMPVELSMTKNTTRYQNLDYFSVK